MAKKKKIAAKAKGNKFLVLALEKEEKKRKGTYKKTKKEILYLILIFIYNM